MLKLQIIDPSTQHFLISTDEAARIEVSVVDGKVVCYGYRGVGIDQDQDPEVLYVQFEGGPDYMLGDNPEPYIDPRYQSTQS